MNCLGYNVADNFLYAATFNSAPYDLIRISAAGDCINMGSLNVTVSLNCGDVDENSHYWAAASGKQWIQIDLKPGSSTYGRTLNKATASPPRTVWDWAYIPKKGNFLWSLGYDSNNRKDTGGSNTYLMKFDRSLKTWTEVIKFGDIAGAGDTPRNGWGAVYASDDGFLYGSENASGEIWRFPVPNNGTGLPSGSPVKVSNGPASPGGNDGARCINAANI